MHIVTFSDLDNVQVNKTISHTSYLQFNMFKMLISDLTTFVLHMFNISTQGHPGTGAFAVCFKQQVEKHPREVVSQSYD